MNDALVDGFTHHHRTLDEDFEKAKKWAQDGELRQATQALRDFREAIERHMGAEEQRLFPAYESRHGQDNPLTAILRKGHRDLRGFFDEIEETLEAGDQDEATSLMGTVEQILHHHDEKEEQEFYPAVAPLIEDASAVLSALGG